MFTAREAHDAATSRLDTECEKFERTDECGEILRRIESVIKQVSGDGGFEAVYDVRLSGIKYNLDQIQLLAHVLFRRYGYYVSYSADDGRLRISW